MSSRQDQLKDITKFIDESQTEVNNILEELGWNEEHTLRQFNKNENCPADTKTNEDESDPLYPPSYPWKHAVAINSNCLNQILKTTNKVVPEKYSDFQTNFTREQKLRLYEYAIERTGKLSEPEVSVIFSQNESGKKEMTFAEIVAFKRDLKRRRLKYRTTKVPPLSHTEEVRNLIELQMQALSQYMQPEKKENIDTDKNRPGTSKENNLSCGGAPYTSERKRSKSKSVERKSHKKTKKKHRSHSRDRVGSSRDKREQFKMSTSHYRKKRSHNHRKRSRSRDQSRGNV